MSCESYVRKRSVLNIDFGKLERAEDPLLQFRNDYELLAYLLDQELKAEQTEAVSFESLTSD